LTRKSTITVEVAPGELFDKITILEIKAERIGDSAKLANVLVELRSLEAARDRAVAVSPELAELTAQLKAVNERLWHIQEGLRDCARQQDFGERFVEVARAEFMANDERALIKRGINLLLGSHLVEEKSYGAY